MTREDSEPQHLMKARTVGGFTAAGVAVTTGATLGLLAGNSVGLRLAVAAVAVGVAAFAFRAGRTAGEKIVGRSWPTALGIGALGGLVALLVAAVSAALAGSVWGLLDGARDSHWLWDYLGKPFVGVLGYGCLVAPVLGAGAGAIIRALTGRAK